MERIDKLIASQGMLSRKQVKELLSQGAVTVNGQVIRRPEYKAEETDRIEIGSKPLTVQRFTYLMLNKPTGVVSATEDERQKTVVDLVPPELKRKGLFPAGRLDKDTEGFVLLTDDGAFAHRILSPRHHVPKTYLAQVSRPLSEEELRQFSQGLLLSTGEQCLPAKIRLIEEAKLPTYEVILFEGMYHQIKRMFSFFHSEVCSLKRVRMGNLWLDESLAPGECRALSEQEVLCILQYNSD